MQGPEKSSRGSLGAVPSKEIAQVRDKLDELQRLFAASGALLSQLDRRGFDAIAASVGQVVGSFPRLNVCIPAERAEHPMCKALIDTYDIFLIRRGALAFGLPGGRSFLDPIADASDVIRELDKRDALPNDRAQRLADDPIFGKQSDAAQRFAVEGCMLGSLGRHVKEQRQLAGGALCRPERAMAAHLLYFALTGQDLFEGKLVRTFSGGLQWTGKGIDFAFPKGGDQGAPNVGAAVEIPYRDEWTNTTALVLPPRPSD